MITVASMSHRTAPLHVRERLAIDADRTSSVLGRAHDRFGGAVILDTCNRLEIYVSGEHVDDDMLGFLVDELGVESDVARRSFRISRGADAARHLCRVACGLESMVLGESEVLGQVRSALSSATAAGATDRTLAHLFHVAIRAGRRARAETAIGRHSLSVSSLAVREVQEHIPNLRAASALVIGAGEAGRLAAQSLAALAVRDLVIVNRTRARAEALADDVGGRAVPWSELAGALAGCDIVIGATAGSGHALDREAIRAAASRREGPPLLLIDLVTKCERVTSLLELAIDFRLGFLVDLLAPEVILGEVVTAFQTLIVHKFLCGLYFGLVVNESTLLGVKVKPISR